MSKEITPSTFDTELHSIFTRNAALPTKDESAEGIVKFNTFGLEQVEKSIKRLVAREVIKELPPRSTNVRTTAIRVLKREQVEALGIETTKETEL